MDEIPISKDESASHPDETIKAGITIKEGEAILVITARLQREQERIVDVVLEEKGGFAQNGHGRVC